MVDKQHYDFKHREVKVQAAMANLVCSYVYGTHPGGLQAAIHDFRQKMRGMVYAEQYIEDAAADCERLGTEGWKKRHGLL